MAKGSKGKVVQVIGTVVDVEFPAEELPEIYSAVELDNSGAKLVLEVEQHVGNSWARCLALGAQESWCHDPSRADAGARPRFGHGGVHARPRGAVHTVAL